MSVPRLFDGATPWTDDDKPADRTRLNAVKAHGGVAVSVYIVGRPGGMRHAVKRDVDAARALELAVLPNWERAADYFRTCTLAEAKAAGVEALAACRDLGIPDDAGIGCAFSFDFDCPASLFDQMCDKLTAAGKGMAGGFEPVGYGQADLIEHWAANGLPGPHWLMGSTWRASPQFTPAEVGSPHVALVQSHDAAGRWLTSPVVGADVNTITQPDKLAAWWPDDSPYGGGMSFTIDDLLNTEIDGKDGNGNPVKWTIRTWIGYTSAQASRENAALAAQVAALGADLEAVKAQLAQPAATVAISQDIPAVLHIGGTK